LLSNDISPLSDTLKHAKIGFGVALGVTKKGPPEAGLLDPVDLTGQC
jgi:hypothetical protein